MQSEAVGGHEGGERGNQDIFSRREGENPLMGRRYDVPRR